MRGMGSPLQQGAAESSTIRSGSREPVRWQHGHVHACHRQLLPCCLALTCGALGPGHRCASAAACKHCPGSQGGPGNTGKRTAALCSVSLPCHCIDTSAEAVLCSCSSQGNSYVPNYVRATSRLTSLSSEENPRTLPLSTSSMLRGTFTAALGVGGRAGPAGSNPQCGLGQVQAPPPTVQAESAPAPGNTRA